MPEDLAPVTLFEVTLSRTIHADGELGFLMTTPTQFSFVEVLGLLDGARWQLFRMMSERYGN